MLKDILADIAPKFPPIKGKGLNHTEMFAATLRFLAEGSYQHGAGQSFNVAIAQPTFSVVFAKTLKILEDTLCHTWISVEMSNEEQQKARRYFLFRSGIPGVVWMVRP